MSQFYLQNSEKNHFVPLLIGNQDVAKVPPFVELRKKDFSVKFLHNALKSYIPPNVWDRIAGADSGFKSFYGMTMEEYLKPVFASSASDMKRYGSIQELVHELEAYISFPGAHQALGSDCWDPYCAYPYVYNSQSNPCENYVAKQDLLVLLQNQLSAGFSKVSNLTGDIVFSVLAAYLKFREENLENHCEFVQLPDNFCATIEAETRQQRAWYISPFPEAHKYTYQTFLKKVKTLVPTWNDTKHAGIIGILKTMREGLSPKQFAEIYDSVLNSAQMMIRVSDTIITNHPTFFLPNSYTSIIDDPTILRLFQDGSRQFIMVDELKSVVLGIPLDKLLLETVDLEGASRLLRGVQVEYINTNIIRAKHCAQPVRDPYGKYCKLAVDHLFELLQDLIFGLGVFQRIRKEQWPRVVELFAQYSCQFDPEKTSMYFIRKPEGFLDCEQLEKHFFGCLERPAKYVRNAKADGFTVQSLKNELKYLGLVEVFPDITDYAEVVYEHVLKFKKKPVLRTCDLFDAVEHCQLICFFKKMPELTRFLHNQSGCNRVLVTDCCSECTEKPLGEAVKEEKPAGKLDEDRVEVQETVSKDLKKPVEDHMEKTAEKSPQRRSRFAESQWNTISLSDVDVQIVKSDPHLDRKCITETTLICANGLELLNNDTAIQILLNKCFPEDPEKRIEIAEKVVNRENRNIFILEREEFDEFISAFDFETDPDVVLNACRTLENIHEFSKRKRRKTIYLQFWDRNLMVLAKTLLDMIPILLEQQGDRVDYDKLDAYWVENYSAPFAWLEVVRLNNMEKILDEFEVDKSLITLVPEIERAASELSLSYKCPKLTYEQLEKKLADVEAKLERREEQHWMITSDMKVKLADLEEYRKNWEQCARTAMKEAASLQSQVEKHRNSLEAAQKKIEKREELRENCARAENSVKNLQKKLTAVEKELRDLKARKKVTSPEPKESANCEKCFRTSTMCTEAKKEAASLQSQVEKLKKSSAAAEKEFKERQLKEEKRNTETVNRLTEELNLVKNELDEQKESCKLAEGSALHFENVELAKSNSERDRIIRLLKGQIPKEALKNLEIEKTAEMKRVFVDLVEKSNELKSSSSLGNAMKQMHTFISMNDDPMVRKRVEFEMLQFRVEFQKYSSVIEQNIKRITEDALITRDELIPLPDPPSLSEVILEEFQKAQDAKNLEIDQECMICMKQLRKKKKDTHQCSGCKKKFHVDCVRDWWIRKDTTECPHCKIDIL